MLTDSYYQKRIDDGDLCIIYNADGSIQLAYIYLYKGERLDLCRAVDGTQQEV